MFSLTCSKFGLKISGTCSRRSKFDPPKFEEFEVRLFDVRSKTSSVLTYSFLKVFKDHKAQISSFENFGKRTC